MIKTEIIEALNNHLNVELYSSYLYLSMSASLRRFGLKGMAHWMRIQAQEEMGHAMRIVDYLGERNGEVALFSIEAPPRQWNTVLTTFEDALAHEEEVTSQIHQLSELVDKHRDHATGIFLQWFSSEQVEEEARALEIVDRLRLIGQDGGAILELDKELSTRVLTATAANN